MCLKVEQSSSVKKSAKERFCFFLKMSNTPSPDSEDKDIHPSSATNKTNKMSVLGSAFSAWPSAGCKGHRPGRSQLVRSSLLKFFLNTLKKICTVVAERTQSARATGGTGRDGGLEAEPASALLVVDLVDSGFLIPRARHDVLIVYWDVAAQHRWRLLRLWGK